MSDVVIRDSRGTVCPVDEARDEIRAAFGHSTDEALAANAGGEVHPSQAATLARHVRTQRRMVHVLMSAPAVLGAVIVSIVAANDPGVHANVAAWTIAAAAVIVLLAQVIA